MSKLAAAYQQRAAAVAAAAAATTSDDVSTSTGTGADLTGGRLDIARRFCAALAAGDGAALALVAAEAAADVAAEVGAPDEAGGRGRKRSRSPTAGALPSVISSVETEAAAGLGDSDNSGGNSGGNSAALAAAAAAWLDAEDADFFDPAAHDPALMLESVALMPIFGPGEWQGPLTPGIADLATRLLALLQGGGDRTLVKALKQLQTRPPQLACPNRWIMAVPEHAARLWGHIVPLPLAAAGMTRWLPVGSFRKKVRVLGRRHNGKWALTDVSRAELEAAVAPHHLSSVTLL